MWDEAEGHGSEEEKRQWLIRSILADEECRLAMRPCDEMLLQLL